MRALKPGAAPPPPGSALPSEPTSHQRKTESRMASKFSLAVIIRCDTTDGCCTALYTAVPSSGGSARLWGYDW